MSNVQSNPIASEKTEDRWQRLYTIGGLSALLMVLIIPIQMVVFTSAPPPTSALGWFELFQQNALLGLLSFELLFIVYGVLSVPLTIALYIALRRNDESLTVLFLGLSLVGTAALFSARPAFEMLSLSGQYAAATSDAQRATILAAGQGMLAIFHGTSYLVSYVLGSINGLIISLVMLRSDLFKKATAYLRIASSVLDFGLFIPVVGLYISVGSVLLLLIWNVVVGRRFLQLGKGLPNV